MSVIVSDPTWVATTWDDPRAVELREAMTADLAPRYAELWEQRARLFAPAEPGGLSTVPTSEEILVTWIALDGAQAVATGSLRLQTGTRQPEAVALYEREGWTRIDPYPPYPPESSICFEKIL